MTRQRKMFEKKLTPPKIEKKSSTTPDSGHPSRHLNCDQSLSFKAGRATNLSLYLGGAIKLVKPKTQNKKNRKKWLKTLYFCIKVRVNTYIFQYRWGVNATNIVIQGGGGYEICPSS